MRKRKYKSLPLGLVVAQSLAAAFGAGIAVYIISFFVPNSPTHIIYDLVVNTNSPALMGSPLYQVQQGRLDSLDMLVASPLAALIGGIVLGWIMGEQYGQERLLKWALGCGTFFFLTALAFSWGAKLLLDQMRIQPGEITAQIVTAQILGLVLWIGIYVLGAEIGRRFHGAKTTPATSAPG